jgi:transposase
MRESTTGEVVRTTLKHEGTNVREFYGHLPRPVRVGIEASGSLQWFVNLMEELGIECLVGHAAEIRACQPRKQKHDRGMEQQARERSAARLLMTHSGVGPLTALATEVFLGDPARFADSKALASYVGMIPGEYSRGKRQRLGGLTKQGNPLLRFLWSEAAIHAVRGDAELKHFYRRKLIQKGLGKARAAVARKLGIRMWIMLRDRIEYNEFCRRGQMQQKSGDACAGMPEARYGAKVTG